MPSSPRGWAITFGSALLRRLFFLLPWEYSTSCLLGKYQIRIPCNFQPMNKWTTKDKCFLRLIFDFCGNPYVLKGHPHHTRAYLLLSWYFVWEQRDKSFISPMGHKLDIKRSLSAAGCCAPYLVSQPTLLLFAPCHDLHTISCHLTWEVPGGMEAALLPFQMEGENDGCESHCVPYPLPLPSPHTPFTSLALNTCCVHMHI